MLTSLSKTHYPTPWLSLSLHLTYKAHSIWFVEKKRTQSFLSLFHTNTTLSRSLSLSLSLPFSFCSLTLSLSLSLSLFPFQFLLSHSLPFSAFLSVTRVCEH